jgi:hypothetical protein
MKNKYQIVALLVFGIFYIPVFGQELIPIDEKDAHWKIVQKEIERITKPDPNSLAGIKIDNYGLLNIKDAKSLFPDWKFYGFDYSMYVKNNEDKNKVNIAFGLGCTLAVFSNSNSISTFRFYKYGNYEEYGEFLKVNKISVRDVNNAKLIWYAFCEIHRNNWKSYEIKNVSDNEWRLGISSYERNISSDKEFNTIVTETYFYKVTTDPNTKQITDWKSTVETSNKRLEKIQ